MTPIWSGEALQVLRYRKDQKYDSHVSAWAGEGPRALIECVHCTCSGASAARAGTLFGLGGPAQNHSRRPGPGWP
jgi:hypothetical protein